MTSQPSISQDNNLPHDIQHPLMDWLNGQVKGSWKLLSLPLLFFIVLPVVSIFLGTTPGDMLMELNQQQVKQAIWLSLQTTFCTTTVTLIAGTPVAYLLANKKFKLHHMVDTIIDLPTVLPPSVVGIALLMTFGRRGMLGPILAPLGIQITFTTLAVIMAQTFIAAPFYIKAASIGFRSIDSELLQAAALDGASRWQIFRFIILPMSWIALLSGSVMTWARAMGEFGATILFAGNFPGRTQTMPLAIYIGFELELKVALTLSIILICSSFLALILLKVVLHRQMN